jgi:pseudouridine-5'-phosphate glycosidase
MMRVSAEVAEALAHGRPVVALESTLVSHGLPRPRNLEVAREVETAVRDGGAAPATVGVIAGEPVVGLGPGELAAIAGGDDVVKCGLRDLAPAAACGVNGATTVAATAHLAARAGISLFATGGLGGVHRGARDTWDESADLETLSRTPIVVVCSGVKSILDVGATLERLETLNVVVLGYQTDDFPGFYLPSSGHPAPWRVESAAEVSEVMAARADLGMESAIVVANPIEPAYALDPGAHDRTLRSGIEAAERAGVGGKEATPFLLEFFHRETSGASLEANVRLVVANARLAARIAVAASAR